MISLISCVDLDNGIGKDNKLLARQSEDLKRFKNLTFGKYVVMGRNTWESLGSKPLKGRKNIVISSTMEYEVNVDYENDISYIILNNISYVKFLNLQFPANEIMVIGGQSIYEQLLPYASRVYLTKIHSNLEADAHFPTLEKDEWEVIANTQVFDADEKNEYRYEYITYKRI